MFLSRWLAQRRLKNDRAVLERRGVWGDTVEMLSWLTEILETCRYKNYSLARGEALYVQVRSPHVDDLVQRLRRAVATVLKADDVHPDKLAALPPTAIPLDQYLLTVSGYPIRPEDVVRVMLPSVKELVQQLDWLRAQADVRDNYYRRQYHHLIAELRSVLEALLYGADQFSN